MIRRMAASEFGVPILYRLLCNKNANLFGVARTVFLNWCYFIACGRQYGYTILKIGTLPKHCGIHQLTLCKLLQKDQSLLVNVAPYDDQ